MSPLRLPRHRFVGAVTVVVLAGALAACSGSTGSGPAAPGPGDPSQAGSGQGGGQRQPGVSGLIAAKTGKTLQVQGTAGQTAVTYTSKTAFTAVATGSATAVKAGLCATVRSADETSSAPPSAPTADTVAAGSVTLSKPTGGSCDAGFGGGGFGGTWPSGAPSARPSGAPSGAPNGPGRGLGANGKIISVDGSSFVVQATRPDSSGQQTTTKITVTTGGSTTWSIVTATTAKAVAVGKCATANGSRSTTGAMTATTLRLSKPVNGTCSTGFAGRGGGRPSGGASIAPGNGGPSDGGQGNG